MNYKCGFLILLLFFMQTLRAQEGDCNTASGVISGLILDSDNGSHLSKATVRLFKTGDTTIIASVAAGSEGDFIFNKLSCGFYSISIKMIGYAPLKTDSIYIRQEKSEINLTDILLVKSTSELEVITVYADKPLIENKDGKITFNVSESALSNSSATIDLLKQTPLVSVDPEGKILMRGKEVKVLIDDKPVDMDARQLQDLLESMPGSMIEKIEVLTTPPPQYANERGGVINIVTKKGRVGITGRININYGTRGEAGGGLSGSYRAKKLAVNLNVGYTYNQYEGSSSSFRENFYTDSSNYFTTSSVNQSASRKPNGRLSVDYEFNKKNSFNFALLYNANNNSGRTETYYKNINRFNDVYRLSGREVNTGGATYTPSFNFAYALKTKRPGEVLKINGSLQSGRNDNDRDFHQEYLHPSTTVVLSDSMQQQITAVNTRNSNLRFNYDRPIKLQKYSFNVSGHYMRYATHNVLSTLFMKNPENVYVASETLSNNIWFYQKIFGIRSALRYTIKQDFFINAGVLQEFTETNFDLTKVAGDYKNNYLSMLPFLTMTRKWESGFNITGSYKRTIQRPGLNQLNPSVDYGDPYNLRFGNPYLNPYYADNLDLIGGYWSKLYTFNLSLGYNILHDIYSSIRTLQPDAKTTTTWQNISGRREYESNFWTGITLHKKLKVNLSAGYTYNVYSMVDRVERKYRNGGSFTSSLNGNYTVNPSMTATGSFTYNSFATPQGKAKNRLSMNVGVQQKFFKKNMTVSLQAVDPFTPQQNNTIIMGKGYMVESKSLTRSENYRLALAYNFKKMGKKKKGQKVPNVQKVT